MAMKYIRFKIVGLPRIVVFDKIFNHADIVSRLKEEPVSAGFVNEGWECYGESISLKLKSLPEDTGILKRLLSL